MAEYECTDRASTWVSFVSGVLMGSGTPIQVATRVQGEYAGKQAITNDSILRLGDGRFTKAKWFRLIPATPPPPAPPPDEIPVTNVTYAWEVVEDSAGNVVSAKFFRNGVQIQP